MEIYIKIFFISPFYLCECECVSVVHSSERQTLLENLASVSE